MGRMSDKNIYFYLWFTHVKVTKYNLKISVFFVPPNKSNATETAQNQ